MKFLEHTKLAAFTGLVVGILHGTIDIIIRIAVFSFEWFEFYQTLLLSSIVFTFGFIILSLFIELIRKIIKLKITKKTLIIFYFTSAIFLLVIFYVSTILNRFILREIAFFEPISLALNFAVFVVVGSIYFLFLTKAKDPVYNIVYQLKRREIKKIIKNVVYIIILFIITSFFLDIFLLNYVPNFKSSIEKTYPNILFIMVDSTRADHLSLYGYPLKTSPNLDEFAKDAVVFDNAISAGTGTLPVLPILFTGKYVSNHGVLVLNLVLNSKETTIAEILREKGYNTVGFVGGVFQKAKYGFGQGFIYYKDRQDFFEYIHTFEWFGLRQTLTTFLPNYKSLMKQDGERTSEELNRDVFKWLDKNKDEPFFMFISYEEPHVPYTLGSEFRKKSNDTRNFFELSSKIKKALRIEKSQRLKRYGNTSRDIIDAYTNLYDAEIMYFDHNLGKLLKKLDELNIKENTIIIITSDHGEEFYDHGSFGHGETVYQEIIHVPLIIYYPKEFEPRRIEKSVSNADIVPTILDILEIEIPEEVDGFSLVPLLKGENGYNRKYSISEEFGRPGLQDYEYQIAIIKDDWKLIEVIPKIETIPSGLYNLRTDPKEQRNLYDSYVEKRKELQKYIPEVTDKFSIAITNNNE